MNNKLAFALAISTLTTHAFSQNVPALNGGSQSQYITIPATNSMPEQLPPLHLISPEQLQLDDKEIHGLKLAEKWKQNPDKPQIGKDGNVKYLFGATLPTLVCSPLQICSIALQPGEIVNDIHLGDKVRWSVTPATQGVGANTTTFIIVKPNNAGLVTSLLVVTDKRTYTIKLASSQKSWIPVLSFDYPDEMNRAWQVYKEAQVKYISGTTMSNGQNLAHLDFDFTITGDNPAWKPQRVYTDGNKTYIQFPNDNFGGDAPALVALGKGGVFRSDKELINYRVIGDRYVVDKVIDRAALIQGVGRQQVKVTLSRKGN